MNIAYLGLFQTILNWIIEKIFSPVFKFVANLLATVFGWIFDNILGPLLETILIPIAKEVIDLIFEAFAEVFYRLLRAILRIVDYMQIAFDVLIGIRPVAYTPPGGSRIEAPLLDVLFYQDSITKVLLYITFMALAIAFIFTIYATAKSVFDLDFEGRRPVGMVLKAFFRTAISFLLVPLFVLFMVKLSGVVLTGVNTALDQNNKCSLGTTIFLVSSMDASLTDRYNVTYTKNDKYPNIGFRDDVRRPYADGYRSYENLDHVRADFKFSRFDYLVGYGVSLFMMIILAICLVQFVQRIFEIMLLYLVSPLFVSVMPLDEGEKFGAWRELFVSKCFMGFGAAFGMRLYLMVVGIIMGSSIDFTNGGQISTEMDYVLKLLIVMGGAFAIFKSSSMLTMLLSWRSADSESATAAAVGGVMYAHTVGSMTHRISSGVQKQIAGHKNGKDGGSGNAFSGGRGPGAGLPGKQGGGLPGKPGGGLPGMPGGAGPAGHSFISQRTASGRRAIGYQGSHIKTGVGPGGKYRLNEVNTKLLSASRGADGRIGSVSTPLGELKRGAGGRMGLSGINMGVLKTKRGADGRQHLSKVNLGVLKAKRGEEGSLKVTSVNMKAIRFNRLEDGRMHVSSALGQSLEHELPGKGAAAQSTAAKDAATQSTGTQSTAAPNAAHGDGAGKPEQGQQDTPREAVQVKRKIVLRPVPIRTQRQRSIYRAKVRAQKKENARLMQIALQGQGAAPARQDIRPNQGAAPARQDIRPNQGAAPNRQDIRPNQGAAANRQDTRPNQSAAPNRQDTRPNQSAAPARQQIRQPAIQTPRNNQNARSGNYRQQNQGGRNQNNRNRNSRPGPRPGTGPRGGNRSGRR